MLRATVAVIVGYLVSAILVSIGLSVVWLALGPSFAYEPGTLKVTAGWCGIALALGFVGSLAAGWVTALIAPSPRRTPVKVLAGIILVAGLALAALHVAVDEPAKEPAKPVAEMTMFEAASESVAPPWYNFSIAVVGCAGVLVGGRLRCRPAAG